MDTDKSSKEADIRARLLARLPGASNLPVKLETATPQEDVVITGSTEAPKDLTKSRSRPTRKSKKSKKDKKSKKTGKKNWVAMEVSSSDEDRALIDFEGPFIEDKEKEERYVREGCIKMGRLAKFDKWARRDIEERMSRPTKPVRYFSRKTNKAFSKKVKYLLYKNRVAEISISRGLTCAGAFSQSPAASFLKFESYVSPASSIQEHTKLLKTNINQSSLANDEQLEAAWLALVQYQDDISQLDPATLPQDQKLTKQLAILDRALIELPNNLRLEICQAELYEMHYLFSSESRQIKGWEAGLTSFELYRRLCFESEQRDYAPPKLFAKLLLAHLANPHFSVNEHLRFIEKRFQILQNVINRSHSPELLFYYCIQFLLATGHSERAWFLFESNFNFGMTTPKNDPIQEERALNFCCNADRETTLTECWLRSETIRDKTNIRPGPFTWDQDRRVDYRFMNSNLRNVHYYSRDRPLLYRVSLAAFFGRHIFDFDESDAFYNEMELSMMNCLDKNNDVTNIHELYENRRLDDEGMLECLYPVDGITSMYILVLCNDTLKSKTKKTGRNLIKASAGTPMGAAQQNVIMFMYCLLHDNCSELMLKSLNSLSLSQDQCNIVMCVLAWAIDFKEELISSAVIQAVFEKSSKNVKHLRLSDVPFPRMMIQRGLYKLFTKPPRLITRQKSFPEILEEERNRTNKVIAYLSKDRLSVFEQPGDTSRNIVFRQLARLFLMKEKYGANSAQYKSICKRKIGRLVEHPGRLSLDACRCPLLWKLLLNAEDVEPRTCYIIGQKFVGWSKTYQLAFLDRVKHERLNEKELVNSIFMCREYGLRIRTLPEEVAIFVF